MRRRQLPGEPPPPSKTALKRGAHEVQELADRLIGAPENLLASLALPEKLADALRLARDITSHAARVRQRLYLAKLLRAVDPEPIRAALDAEAAATRLEAARFRRAERWRDRLVEDGAPAIAEFLAEHPGVDRETVQRLAAAAIEERVRGAAGGAGRALFRFVSQALSQEPSP